MINMEFYKGKKILITGHTGFKGSWLCEMLILAGANVTGYALEPPTTPSLYEICHIKERINSIEGDVRNLEYMLKVFRKIQPEIVIHMAAQPLVLESYKNPVHTYGVNVMGTVNVLECVRQTATVKAVLNVTTDKVYMNKEWDWGYRENEELNGYDPYSNSKSCSELVTASYNNAFFKEMGIAVSTARAGNVVGGGDFARGRIIPDCVRAIERGEDIIVRNPHSVRPYQHVLEPLAAYLIILEAQYKNSNYAGVYNVGPDETDCWTTGDIVQLFCDKWNTERNTEVCWKSEMQDGPHEANFLKLDCSKMKRVFQWKPKWSVETAMEKIVQWSSSYLDGEDVSSVIRTQIEEFLK